MIAPLLDRAPADEGIARRGLLAEYRMSDASGTLLPDNSGNGNHGTLVGAPTIGTAGITFNGTSQYATLPAGALVSNLPAYSVILAVSGASQSGTGWWSEGDSGNGTTNVLFGPTAGGTLQRHLIRNSASTIELQPNARAVVMDSTLHLVGLVMRLLAGSTSQCLFAVDGVADDLFIANEGTRSSKTINRGTLAAAGRSTYGLFFAGTLYYALLYTRPLSMEDMRHTQRQVRHILRGRGV